MSKGAPPSPTLAPSAQPGANLYNSYHFLTQLSGLYAQASAAEPLRDRRVSWGEACDATLGDLGTVYQVWEWALKAARTGPSADRDERLWAMVARGCRRMALLSDRMNVWTPMSRWAHVLLLGERRWQRTLGRIGALDPDLAPRLALVLTASRKRSDQLQGVLEKYRQEEARLAALARDESEAGLDEAMES